MEYLTTPTNSRYRPKTDAMTHATIKSLSVRLAHLVSDALQVYQTVGDVVKAHGRSSAVPAQRSPRRALPLASPKGNPFPTIALETAIMRKKKYILTVFPGSLSIALIVRLIWPAVKLIFYIN